jgi:hypothetical protein
VQRESVEGDSVRVCDPRGAESSRCIEDVWCISGMCAAGECTAAEGAPNGSPCERAEDCADGTCVNAECRGAGVIGSACEVDADCAVGRCEDGECT